MTQRLDSNQADPKPQQSDDPLLDQYRWVQAERDVFRDLFDQAPDPYLVTDLRGVIQRANVAAARLLGGGVQQLVGSNLAQWVASHHGREVFQQHMLATLQAGQKVRGEELRLHCDEGQLVRPTAIDAGPVHDAEGRVIGARWIIRDINREKQARDALERSEQRFRMLAETSTDMVSRHAPDGTYRYVSPASRSILGYAPEQLIGANAFERVHPDDAPAVLAVHERLVRGRSDVETVSFRKRRCDDTFVWVETSVRAIRDAQGQITALQATTRDVSDRKKAEHALRLVQAAIEQMNEAVVITGSGLDPPEPRIVYVNPAFEEMTGYTASEVIGRSPRILQGPKTDRHELDRLRRAMERGQGFRGEVINYRKDGREFNLEWHIAPVREVDGGAITHWVAIQRDITQQREAERQAREHEAEMAHVARLSTMGEMASGLAHELNQPLAAISNYVSGCTQRLSQADREVIKQTTGLELDWFEDALNRIGHQADRAGQIIRRLRSFVGKREGDREMVNINDLLEDVCDLCKHDLQQSEVEVHCDLPDGLPEVPCDRIQIEQVVLNLVRNATEAMQSNSAADRELWVHSSAEGNGIHLTVRDTGPGMTDEQMERVFEPFYTTKAAGMGVGLNISQSIVQAHDGRLWVERNEDGRGVTFHMSLPGPEPHESEEDQAAA
jgi:two-component system sensor kinase FixL